jgi:endonuclease YncB( thermonuclease family)
MGIQGSGKRRRFLATAALALVGTIAVLLPTGHAAARERDRDCGEFQTQAAAQRFFVGHGGSRSDNFDDLDEDGDGVACESLPCPCSKAAGASGGSPGPSVPGGRRLDALIVRDVDGDTVAARFANGAEDDVRLIGIDTPEDVKPGYPVECGARAATRSMTEMAAGRRAILVADPSQDRFDRYGRLLAYLYVAGRNLNLRQVGRGWGDVYVYEGNPFTQVRAFRRASAMARSRGLGVWGRCSGDFHSAEPGRQN